jgi:hypothetical protein
VSEAADLPAPDGPAVREAAYEAGVRAELDAWKAQMRKPPGPWDVASRNFGAQVNRLVPAQVHRTITTVMEHMTQAIMAGSEFVAAKPLTGAPLSEREALAKKRIGYYRAAAAAEGGVAGAGGFLLNMAEFPVLVATKIKLLFDLAGLYGHDAGAPAERLYILSIFQLAFSSAQHRNDVFDSLEAWDASANFEGFDWRAFQQEYRDSTDLPKMMQMLPVIGAPVGAAVNWGLTEKLGATAMNAYRMRWFAPAPQGALR